MKNLHTYLAEQRITQAGFAAKIGVTQATVSKLIAGTTKPGLDLAVRIERMTDGAVPVDTWVGPATTEEDVA
jgi:plasmid maintenance system antidote protein VapI